MNDDTIKTPERENADDQMVEEAFQRLLKTYLASPHRKKVDIITKAYNFAREAHKGVKRLSGEPYIMHPIAVAQIASEEMGLGSTSICAALPSLGRAAATSLVMLLRFFVKKSASLYR